MSGIGNRDVNKGRPNTHRPLASTGSA
jgi:hypothetical protein